MKTQADALRTLVRQQQQNILLRMGDNSKNTRIITVTSGKGGVGKSNIAVNLAIALAEYNKKTIVLDADLGLANIDVIVGISPQENLASVIFGEKNISDVICSGPRGIRIIPGGSGIHELADLSAEQLERFVAKLSHLEGTADYLIIDTSAGLAPSVMSFTLAADEVILVATPEPTSITDAYGLIKTTSQVHYRGKLSILVNRAVTEKEAGITYSKIQTAASLFLDYPTNYLGFIREDPKVIQAVQAQQPFYLMYPASTAAQDLKAVAAQLCKAESHSPMAGGMKAFFRRVSESFR